MPNPSNRVYYMWRGLYFCSAACLPPWVHYPDDVAHCSGEPLVDTYCSNCGRDINQSPATVVTSPLDGGDNSCPF